MDFRVKLGKQLADVISAKAGTVGELLLRSMTISNGNKRANGSSRWPAIEVSPWVQEDDHETAGIISKYPGDVLRHFTVKIGAREGLFIEEDPKLSTFAVQLAASIDGHVIKVSPRLRFKRKKIHEVGRRIIAINNRGTQWADRTGRVHKSPCGDHKSKAVVPAEVKAASAPHKQPPYFVKQK